MYWYLGVLFIWVWKSVTKYYCITKQWYDHNFMSINNDERKTHLFFKCVSSYLLPPLPCAVWASPRCWGISHSIMEAWHELKTLYFLTRFPHRTHTLINLHTYTYCICDNYNTDIALTCTTFKCDGTLTPLMVCYHISYNE